MGATFGRNLRMTIFGESHGRGIGLVLDGLPPGTPIDEEFIKAEMARQGVSMRALAKMLKWCPSKMCSKMNGKQPFWMDECEEIKSALHLSIPIVVLFKMQTHD